MILNNTETKTDAHGYLTSPQDWNEGLAVEIARLEGLILSEAHWQIIHFLRTFYLRYNTSPAMRMLVKGIALAYGKEKGNSRYLFHLFPLGPAKQAAKIAGLPKPVKCL